MPVLREQFGGRRADTRSPTGDDGHTSIEQPIPVLDPGDVVATRSVLVLIRVCHLFQGWQMLSHGAVDAGVQRDSQ